MAAIATHLARSPVPEEVIIRKHLCKTAQYWFDAGMSEPTRKFATIALANAYNHVENALAHILEKFPEAKAEFERIENKTS